MLSMPTARDLRSFPASLAEELLFWAWRTYGTCDEEGLLLAATDMDKISRGIPVERWGCPFEVLK